MTDKRKKTKMKPFRFHPETYDALEVKLKHYNITFQKLGELLFGAFLRGNREVERIVERYLDNLNRYKVKTALDPLEMEMLMSKIEEDSIEKEQERIKKTKDERITPSELEDIINSL